jgi:hypothetical protein
MGTFGSTTASKRNVRLSCPEKSSSYRLLLFATGVPKVKFRINFGPGSHVNSTTELYFVAGRISVANTAPSLTSFYLGKPRNPGCRADHLDVRGGTHNCGSVINNGR